MLTDLTARVQKPELTEILRELGSQALFTTVEQARLAARRRRHGDAGAEAELVEVLTDLEPRLALEVVRAFSTYFGLANMAEREPAERAPASRSTPARM